MRCSCYPELISKMAGRLFIYFRARYGLSLEASFSLMVRGSQTRMAIIFSGSLAILLRESGRWLCLTERNGSRSKWYWEIRNSEKPFFKAVCHALHVCFRFRLLLPVAPPGPSRNFRRYPPCLRGEG